MSTKVSTPIRIVVADDDEDDCFFISRALATSRGENDVTIVRNGEELLKLLRGSGEVNGESSQPWPDLILLDLNMPCMDGRETLAAIKSDPQLRSIPIVVLTTSSMNRDVASCYELGVNSYLVKPRAYAELLDVMQRLLNYWFDLVVLPRSDGPGIRP